MIHIYTLKQCITLITKYFGYYSHVFITLSAILFPTSDEFEIFYTEHDFQVDLENLRVQLEISCRENTTYYT